MKHPLSSLLGCLKIPNEKCIQCTDVQPPESVCRQFSLAEIKAATNNFHSDLLIDDFGFGETYKGIIDDGTTVFVKSCKDHFQQRIEDFRTEVELLCQLRHPHLVSLNGFCVDQNKMFVVLEYMSRGSLGGYLVGNGVVPLTWKQRLQICIGAARGLHYLHAGAKHAIIHRGIKSTSIMLDDEFSVKLCGLGISKIGARSTSKAPIKMKVEVSGTIGYLEPHYSSTGELTDKSDVYSFGVVLFEVLCGKRTFDAGRFVPQINWVKDSLMEGNIYQVIDPYLGRKITPECLKKYLEIAFSCVRFERNERPDMGEVEVTLELVLELQEKADSEMEHLHHHGDFAYEEAPFCASDINVAVDVSYEAFNSGSDDNSVCNESME